LITRELFNLVSFNLTSVFFLFDYSEKLHICLFCVFRFSKNPLPQKLPRSHLRKPDRRHRRFRCGCTASLQPSAFLCVRVPLHIN